MADSLDYCANECCMQRFEGKTPQESVAKLVAHKAKCDALTPEQRKEARKKIAMHNPIRDR